MSIVLKHKAESLLQYVLAHQLVSHSTAAQSVFKALVTT